MNENEINLVRDYVHFQYLIKESIKEIERLKTSRIALGGMLMIAVKGTGRKLQEKLRDTQKRLRECGIHVWIEDDGDGIIYVCTAKNGVKGRHGMKRSIMLEDIEVKLFGLMEEFMDHDVSSVTYKVGFPARDMTDRSYNP